jgi:DnaJ family protein C protein 13
VSLVEAGALSYIVTLLLGYDSTLAPEAAARLVLPFGPGSGPEEVRAALGAPLMRANLQEARSQQALLAARALARLGGMLPEPHNTPSCDQARLALCSLLTESLAARLAAPDPRPLLSCLGSSSVETAHVIWNNSMREELIKVRSGSLTRQTSALRHNRSPALYRTTAHLSHLHARPLHDVSLAIQPYTQTLQRQRERGADLHALQAFRFSGLAGELQVGGVFVRVFNQRAKLGTAAAEGAAALAGAATGAAGASAAVPSDPAGFCKVRFAGLGGRGSGSCLPRRPNSSINLRNPNTRQALVRFLYERLVEKAQRGADLRQLPAAERAAALEVLTALGALLQQEPRLLGLLTSKSALSPLVAALAPAAAAATAGAASASAAIADGGDTAGEEYVAAAALVGSSGGADGGGDGDAAVAADAEALAAASLSLLAGATQSATLVAALVDEPFVRTLLWLAHTPPSHRVQQGALGLLRTLGSAPAVGLAAGYQGGAVLLLDVLLHPPGAPWPWAGGAAPGGAADDEAARGAAAAVLGRAMADATHGPRIKLVLGQLLPPGLVATVGEGPPEAVLRALAQVGAFCFVTGGWGGGLDGCFSNLST